MTKEADEVDRRVRQAIPRPNRPMAPFRYYGGKGNLAPRILRWVRGGKVYVEPYCGAASVFWRKPPHEVEVLNDLDGDVVNVFRCLQFRFNELAHRLTWTPYSLAEFRRAIDILNKPKNGTISVERAWAFVVTRGQGFNGKTKTEGDWSKAFISRGGIAETCNKWRGRLRMLDWWHNRLTKVQIDCRDALEVIRYWDGQDTVFYLDPPYAADTRESTGQYKHEATDEHLYEMVSTILGCKGRVVLSGYCHKIFEPLEEDGWRRVDIHTACHAAGRMRGTKLRGEGAALRHAARVESLWINRPPDGEEKLLF